MTPDDLVPYPGSLTKYHHTPIQLHDTFRHRRFFRVALKLDKTFRRPVLLVVDNASSGCLDRDLWIKGQAV